MLKYEEVIKDTRMNKVTLAPGIIVYTDNGMLIFMGQKSIIAETEDTLVLDPVNTAMVKYMALPAQNGKAPKIQCSANALSNLPERPLRFTLLKTTIASFVHIDKSGFVYNAIKNSLSNLVLPT